MSRVVDEILGLPQPEPRRRLAVAIGAAVAVHLALWLWALSSEPSLESWSALIAARVHAELSREISVELPLPPVAVTPPPPRPQPLPPAGKPSTAVSKASPTPRAAAQNPPAQAQAAAVVAAEPPPDSPIDLTQDTFVTGSATAYAGGVTASAGTNPNAAPSQDVGRAAKPVTIDRSSPVTLAAGEWTCPWPPSADAEQLDEQTVVIRAMIRADGSAESAQVVTDPGHGFGPAAIACALRTRFSPAHDDEGRAVRASSPLIRVRFTR